MQNSAQSKVAQIKPYISILRPAHWLKNFFIFAPLFFAKDIFVAGRFWSVALTFVLFCMTASAVYIFNDIRDKNHDINHPKKSKRAIASGVVSVYTSSIVAWLLAIVVFLVGIFFNKEVLAVILAYGALNLLYSTWLKHVAVVDLVVVAALYLIRVVAGGVAADVSVSSWLILCTFFLALFVITGKRRAEFIHKTEARRKVLAEYSAETLDLILVMFAGMTIMAYSLYSILGTNIHYATYSVVFVIVGIVRYFIIIRHSQSEQAEFPERLVIKDPFMYGTLASWLIYMFIIFYW